MFILKKKKAALSHTLKKILDTQMLASGRGWSNVPLQRGRRAPLGVALLPSCVVAGSPAGHLANVCVAPCHSPAGQLPSYGGYVILLPTPCLKQLWLFWALILSLSLSKKETSGKEYN